MIVYAICDECNRKHRIDFDPLCGQSHQLFADWYVKHPNHKGVRFVWPERTHKPSWIDKLRSWWSWSAHKVNGVIAASPHLRRMAPWELRTKFALRNYQEMASEKLQGFLRQIADPPAAIASMLDNSDVKVSYAASASPTITLNSLAASSTWLAGRESTAIDNGASVKYLDYMAAGIYTADNTNNQAGSIYTGVVGAVNDTPTWPDVFDGTDSAETVTDSGTFNSIVRVFSSIAADNTASQAWPFGPTCIAGMFGGAIPDQFVYFVTHNIQTSTNAWESSGHTFSHTPIYLTVA